jgi:hypothetical protein
MTEKLFNREKKWLTCLQNDGYRLTRPRRAVVSTLAKSQRALSPTQIYNLAREQYASLGLVSVYRTLETLDALGLIQRVPAIKSQNTGFSFLVYVNPASKTPLDQYETNPNLDFDHLLHPNSLQHASSYP